MIPILDVNISQYDLIIIGLSLTIIPILFIVLLILLVRQFSKKKSILLAKSQLVISSLLFLFSLMVLAHQLQGNYQEEALLSIISGVLILISIGVFTLNKIKIKKLLNDS